MTDMAKGEFVELVSDKNQLTLSSDVKIMLGAKNIPIVGTLANGIFDFPSEVKKNHACIVLLEAPLECYTQG